MADDAPEKPTTAGTRSLSQTCNVDSTFGLRHSFVLRHSCFEIVQRREHEQEQEQE
jgi:hypothetical protein